MFSLQTNKGCHSPILPGQNFHQVSTEDSQTNNHQFSAASERFHDTNLSLLALEKSDQPNQFDKQAIRKLRKENNQAAKQKRVAKACCKISQERLVVPTHIVLSPKKIQALRFSQDSICDQTRDGMPLDKLQEEIQKEWKKGQSIRVVKMPGVCKYFCVNKL